MSALGKRIMALTKCTMASIAQLALTMAARSASSDASADVKFTRPFPLETNSSGSDKGEAVMTNMYTLPPTGVWK